MFRRNAARLLIAATWALGACGISDQASPQLIDSKSVPFDLLEKSAPTLVPRPAGPNSETAQLCFVRDHRLEVVAQPLAAPVSITDVVNALREIPITGAELRTTFGGEPLVGNIRLISGVVHVDLLPAIADLGGDSQLLTVAELVCSLTARPGIGQVSFSLLGAPVEVPRADGSSTVGAVSRDDYAALIDGGG